MTDNPHRYRGIGDNALRHAREMRKHMTPSEQRLWAALRGRALAGWCFRRQHPVGPYILDFFCPAAKVVVEVDGSAHAGREAFDDARTDHLGSYGYTVLRFSNGEVDTCLDWVLERILEELERRRPGGAP